MESLAHSSRAIKRVVFLLRESLIHTVFTVRKLKIGGMLKVAFRNNHSVQYLVPIAEQRRDVSVCDAFL